MIIMQRVMVPHPLRGVRFHLALMLGTSSEDAMFDMLTMREWIASEGGSAALRADAANRIIESAPEYTRPDREAMEEWATAADLELACRILVAHIDALRAKADAEWRAMNG